MALSKYGTFQRKGQAWFCTTGLPSDVTVEVDEMLFHLHKFPLIARSGKLSKLMEEADPGGKDNVLHIHIHGMPGGPDTFELAMKFCYGVKLELTASNVAALRCAAAYLEMTEEYSEANLVFLTDSFINQTVVRSWKDSIRTLKTCEVLLPLAEELQIVKKCVDSIVLKACTEPSSLQSPDGTLLWNGISTGARPKNSRSNWWYEDVAALNLPLFKYLITAMEERGLQSEIIGGAIMHYGKKLIPGLCRRQEEDDIGSIKAWARSSPVMPCEAEQVFVLETIETLLPVQEGAVSTKFLLGVLRIAIILNASPICRANLEKRIGPQLYRAALDDVLIPSYSYSQDTLYDIDCMQRIVHHFLGSDKALQTTSIALSPPTPVPSLVELSPMEKFTPLMAVGRLLDSYLAEIAPDSNLSPAQFQELAELLPEYARISDDGLYRAIDIFLKAHPFITEAEREMLCSSMDGQKLSLEACTHAAQNERLPLRTVVQVLFLEQLHLREAIFGYMIAEDAQATPLHGAGGGGRLIPLPPAMSGGGAASSTNTALRVDMVSLQGRVGQLEQECARLRNQVNRQQRRKPTLATWAAIIGCRPPAEDAISGSLHNNIAMASTVSSPAPAAVPSPSRPRLSHSCHRHSSPRFSTFS